MADAVAAAAGATRRRFGPSWVATRDQAIFTVATLAAWAHTLDELRIGELVALPFASANAALVALWPRLSTRAQAGTAVGFGLFWGLAAIPYHAIPLIEGAATWQHVSGLSRIVAGVAMVALGMTIALRRRDKAPPGRRD